MKTTISLLLAFTACRVCCAQYGYSGGFDTADGYTIRLESKLEPPKPDSGSAFSPGVVMGVGKSRQGKGGMRRYLKSNATHEYFGYSLRVETVDTHAGTYRLTFSALDLTPEDLDVPDPASWHMLPAPIFPAPEIVSTSDTIAVDVFENPATGQKIVDYIRISRKNCDSLTNESDQIACLKSILQDERQLLTEKMTRFKNSKDAATVAIMERAQQAWETFKAVACNSQATEAKRLDCEINLTRSRRHDL